MLNCTVAMEYQFFLVTAMTQPGKIPTEKKREPNPGLSLSRGGGWGGGGGITTRPTRRYSEVEVKQTM